MKLVNCILFAALALGATFAHAQESKAACTSEPSGNLTSDRSSLDLLSNRGGAPVSHSSGVGSAR